MAVCLLRDPTNVDLATVRPLRCARPWLPAHSETHELLRSVPMRYAALILARSSRVARRMHDLYGALWFCMAVTVPHIAPLDAHHGLRDPYGGPWTLVAL